MPLPLLAALAPTAIQSGAGLIQSLFSGRRKAEKELERQAANNPIYAGSQPISRLYQTALSRYNENPYQSQQYMNAQKNALRTTASALGALGDRRSALGGVGKIAALQNDAMQQAGVLAENQRNQRFGQLTGATQLKAGDDRFKFQNNELDPYNRRLQLAMLKAGARNQTFNAGLSNIFGGAGNAAMLLSGMNSQNPNTVTNNSFQPLDIQSYLNTRPRINSSLIPKSR